MNKTLRFLAAMLVLTFGLSTAFAEASNPVEVQCPDNFRLIHISQPNDGCFLLTGMAGDPNDAYGMMLCVNTDGQVLWSQKAEGSNRYGGAEYLDKDTIVALRSKGETEKWTVQFIKQGKVVRQTKTLTGVAGIHCTADNLFTYGTPKSHSARIEKFNAEGESIWKIDWKEPLHFSGIVSLGDLHVAYGTNNTRDRRSRPNSVVLAFDDQGKILWRHDSEAYETYCDASWTDGHLVLVGYTIPPSRMENPDPNMDRAENGFVTEYTEQGRVWRMDYVYTLPGDDFPVDNEMTSVVPVQNGCLVSQVAEYKARLLLMDSKGNLVKEWAEDVDGVYSVDFTRLLQSNGKTYLIASGNDGPILGDFGDDLPMPGKITIIKEISVPE